MVDGNVFRVLSRFFEIKKPIDSTEGKNFFTRLAFELLDKKQPGFYNQALMDFGAMVCRPQNPVCTECILKDHCLAFKNKTVKELPVKEKQIRITTRWLNYLVIQHHSKIYIGKRTAKDIWKNLYEFILIETKKEASVNTILGMAEKGILKKIDYDLISISSAHFQQLSHQKINGKFIKIAIKKPLTLTNFKAVSSKQLSSHAFPRLITEYFEKNEG